MCKKIKKNKNNHSLGCEWRERKLIKEIQLYSRGNVRQLIVLSFCCLFFPGHSYKWRLGGTKTPILPAALEAKTPIKLNENFFFFNQSRFKALLGNNCEDVKRNSWAVLIIKHLKLIWPWLWPHTSSPRCNNRVALSSKRQEWRIILHACKSHSIDLKFHLNVSECLKSM